MDKRIYYSITLCLFIPVICSTSEDSPPRIVGGQEEDIGFYPYNVYLEMENENGTISCGGSIVNENTILTAAHCLDDATAALIRIGSSYRNKGGKLYNGSMFFQHPMYRQGSFDYDVGIIKVREDMELDRRNTDRIRLENSASRPAPGQRITITGWGSTQENGELSEVLRGGSVTVRDNAICKEKNPNITRRSFCAGGNRVDTCQGDSGGPAVVESNPRMQVGVTSNGVGCGRPDQPGVYTRISNFQIRLFIDALSTNI